jgi:N-acyl-L-homoserine lactone synthetase
MIDCVSIATSHCFPGNVVAEQHALRYREVIAKEAWSDIYTVDEMEFDRYDNLATEYFIARDGQGRVVGVTRAYPTTIPYMISEVFGFLLSAELPSSPRIFEASRLVLDRSLLGKEERRPVVNKLIVAYMERARQRNIDAYLGFMLPKIWASTFERAGWDVLWAGPEVKLPHSDDVVRAALMPVTEAMNAKVRDTTGIHRSVLNFGNAPAPGKAGVARYSHGEIEGRRAA